MLGKRSMTTTLNVRPATPADDDAIWAILEPTFRAGETYPIPRDITREQALAYWRTPGHWVFVAEAAGKIVGTYYLRANQKGGGAHVCNCGYMTAPDTFGRGVARAMCAHSLDAGARARLYRHAVQFRHRLERTGGEAVAEPGFCHCRHPAGRLRASQTGQSRRAGHGPHAVTSAHKTYVKKARQIARGTYR